MIARRDRLATRMRALAVILLPLAVAGIVGIVPAIERHRVAHAEIGTLERTLDALQQRQRDLGALERLRNSLREADPEDFGLLAASTAELARARIQQMVQATAREAEGRVTQIRTAASASPDLAAVAVTLVVPGDALAPFLHRLAQVQPLLFVEQLDVSAPGAGRGRDRDAVLTVTLTLSSMVDITGAAGAAIGEGQR
ncbi:type II secretion system protein GspM [Futiania mangrovi]|uniref:Type II secretion system protein GspM n=1 Tax=Futiania mangrovi TaxID=2959716 RepID=A0A9J6PJB9_9PROT|nr:type II secretion system protein GspM [Futiania mangrovii]MCP1337875.1 type II secretion system protein GspM [Futiania mangrovii]